MVEDQATATCQCDQHEVKQHGCHPSLRNTFRNLMICRCRLNLLWLCPDNLNNLEFCCAQMTRLFTFSFVLDEKTYSRLITNPFPYAIHEYAYGKWFVWNLLYAIVSALGSDDDLFGFFFDGVNSWDWIPTCKRSNNGIMILLLIDHFEFI